MLSFKYDMAVLEPRVSPARLIVKVNDKRGRLRQITCPIAQGMEIIFSPSLFLSPSFINVGINCSTSYITFTYIFIIFSPLVVNIGTSAQVVLIAPKGFVPPPPNPTAPVEHFPYFDGQYLTVAASLNGGNVIATFVDTLYEWLSLLCHGKNDHGTITKDDVYDRIIKAGSEISGQDTDLIIKPTLNGERHQPEIRASVSNIMADNLSLGHVTRALCRGIVDNLNSMLPKERIMGDGIQRIVGCGSALMRNKILQEELEAMYDGLPVVYQAEEDAAVGAAIAMATYKDKG